jgi:hypothetical protein
MWHSAVSKSHIAEKFHPYPHGLKKQANNKSFISENANIWPKKQATENWVWSM